MFLRFIQAVRNVLASGQEVAESLIEEPMNTQLAPLHDTIPSADHNKLVDSDRSSVS